MPHSPKIFFRYISYTIKRRYKAMLQKELEEIIKLYLEASSEARLEAFRFLTEREQKHELEG